MKSALQILTEDNPPEVNQGRGERLNEVAKKHNRLVKHYLDNPKEAESYIQKSIERCFGNDKLAKVVMYFSEEFQIALAVTAQKNIRSLQQVKTPQYGGNNPCDFL